MFVGHLALGFAAKRTCPTTPLPWFIAAVTALDLVWPLFLLAGVEQVQIRPGATAFNPLVFESYPWSHSLVMAVAWGVVLAGLARWRGVDGRALGVLVLLVGSHWVLDVITHVPDLPLWPGPSPRLGLSLWNSLAGTYLVEGLLWVAGLVIYLRCTVTHSRAGRAAFWSFVLLCTGMWAAGPFGPPPPSVTGLAVFALVGWIVVPWAWWIESTRGLTSAPGARP
ncbi:MAG: hypothetical protein IPL76_05610 [Gemmatimonadetes bacterium]|nr:hypothetical protein [Gemmatimonadota bacterium]